MDQQHNHMDANQAVNALIESVWERDLEAVLVKA